KREMEPGGRGLGCSIRNRSAKSVLSLPEAWIVVQDHIQKGIMDLQVTVVLDEPELAELVHEAAYARPRGADHLRERLLANLRNDRLRSAFLAEIRQQEKSPRQSLLT